MEKLKDMWKGMNGFEKTMFILRDMGCFLAVLSGLLELLGILSGSRTVVAVMLPVVAVAQAALSWKRSRATALFFLGFLVFFFVVFFISKG